MSSRRERLKCQLKEDKRQCVKEMRIALNKLRITRNPKYLLDPLEALVVLAELRLRFQRIMQGTGINRLSHEDGANIKLLDYHVLVDAGSIGDNFISRQLIASQLKGFRNRDATHALRLP